MTKYTKGNATVSIDQDMQEMFMGFLKTVAPGAEEIMQKELKTIEDQAQQDWPKRKPIIKRDANGNVIFSKKTSLESYKKFQRGMKIDANGNFVVFLKNTAPYSYVIKFGQDSENWKRQDIVQPQGKRVADELLIKPHRKSANKVVKALANDLMKRV